MRRSICLGVLLGVGLTIAVPASGVGPPDASKPDLSADEAQPWVTGEVLVKFREGVPRAAAADVVPGARAQQRITGVGADVVRVPPGLSVARAVASFERDPRVEYAEPNLLREPLFTPNDPLFGQLWGLDQIDAPTAWDTQRGSGDTVVAVIDTGVDVTHPDLAESIWLNRGELPPPKPPGGCTGADPYDCNDDGVFNVLDYEGHPGLPTSNLDPDDLRPLSAGINDGNGFTNDVYGWDFDGNDNRPLDSHGHGTHVSGTIAATINNGEGVVGVCPGCRIMPLRFGLTVASEAAAVRYAMAERADLINASYGGSGWSATERNVLRRAGKAGILTVAAVGNDALDNDVFEVQSPLFPASFNLPWIMAVAASDDADRYASFSNWGHDSVDVAAPGVGITSTYPNNRYRTFNGTSMATPHVAGVAGLVKSQHPGYSPVKVKNAIMNSVEHASGLRSIQALDGSGGFTRTNGRVNAAAALTAPTTNATPKTDGNVDGAKRIRKARKGRVSWPADVNDVYKKRLRKGKRYKAVLKVPGGKDFDLWVWKPGTKEIWQLQKLLDFSASGRKGKNEVVKFKARRSAVHYFQASAWLQNAGAYRLVVRRI